MTNAEIATVILTVYTLPGLLIAWFTWNSKEVGEEIDGLNTAEQVLFILINTFLWPICVLKAVGKAWEMRRRNQR